MTDGTCGGIEGKRDAFMGLLVVGVQCGPTSRGNLGGSLCLGLKLPSSLCMISRAQSSKYLSSTVRPLNCMPNLHTSVSQTLLALHHVHARNARLPCVHAPLEVVHMRVSSLPMHKIRGSESPLGTVLHCLKGNSHSFLSEPT